MKKIRRRLSFVAKLLSTLAALSACKGRTTSELQDVSAVNTHYWSEGEYYFRGECPEGQSPSRSCRINLSSLSKKEIEGVRKRLSQANDLEIFNELGLESIASEAKKLGEDYVLKLKLLSDLADPALSRELVNEAEKEFVDKLFRGRAAIIDLKSLAVGGRRTCAINSRSRLQCRGLSLGEGNLLNEDDLKMVSIGGEEFCIIYKSDDSACLFPKPPASFAKISHEKTFELVKDGVQGIFANNGLFCYFTKQTEIKPEFRCSGSTFVEEIDPLKPQGEQSKSMYRRYSFNTDLFLAFKDITSVGVGEDHFCVVADGILRCGGGNLSGQLGTGSTLSSPIDQELKVAVLENVGNASAGDQHTCAAQRDGVLRCWGSDENGQLGHRWTPLAIDEKSIVMRDVKKVVAGGNNTCAILENRDLHCWGETPSKYVSGFVTQENTPMPQGVRETFIHSDVLDVAVSSTHICTLIANQGLKCWGDNSRGQLGFEGETYGDQPGETLDKLQAVFKYKGPF